jgi:hypothetical protein
MKLAAAVDVYLMHRRAMGQKFDGPSVALRAFSRRYGNRSLQGITSSEVKQFLDVPQTGPATWRRKYGVLRDFFAYCRCRGKVNAVPMSLAVPKYTQTFVPCWMQCLVVSDVRHAEHPRLRFAPCCCSSTERVCGWVKR